MEERAETNGGLESEEEERGKMRPADIDADMREMERRKRVEALMTSRLFREELERIVEAHVRDGGAPVGGLLQQIQDMMNTQARATSYGFKGSSCVIPINDIRGVESMGYAKGEKILRCKLAAVYRLMDLYGWTTGINNHVTGRLTAEEEVLLVNAYGMLFHEVTASSLVKVDMQGNIIESGTTNYGVNTTTFQLHAAIHSARPDLKCVIHVHTPSVLAVSSLKVGLLPLSEESAVIGEVSSHTPTGSLQEPEEKDKLIRNLGPINKVLLLSNNGAVCCGQTVEEAFFNVYNTVLACESQMKVMPLGLDNLVLLPDETRKALYDQAHRVPDLTALPSGGHQAENKENKEKRWRIGGLHFEALMRMLDNAGFRTGYIYRTPLVKGEPPKPRNDVEVPPAVSSLGYLLEEEEQYRNWKKMGATKNDRTRWLNSPNVYQKVEILETGTPDPKKITKWVNANGEEWVAEGSPTHSSTPVKITSALQFVPSNTNPREFKKLQQQIKENRRADKITSGPQSHILEGVSWEEAKKLQDANASVSSDQVVLVGAASKGIIQREYQHNATVYKTPYTRNPFDQISQQELDDYKKSIQRKQRGDSYDEDASESEALSSSAALPPSGFKSPPSETEDDSRTEPRVLRIETKTAPLPSQAEYVLSDDSQFDDVFTSSPEEIRKTLNPFPVEESDIIQETVAVNREPDWWRIGGSTEERVRCMARIMDLPTPLRRAMKVFVEDKNTEEKWNVKIPELKSPALVSRATQTILQISDFAGDLCSIEPFSPSLRATESPMESVIGELNERFSRRRLSSEECTSSIPEKEDADTEKNVSSSQNTVIDCLVNRNSEMSHDKKNLINPLSITSAEPAYEAHSMLGSILSYNGSEYAGGIELMSPPSNCNQSYSCSSEPTTYISKTPEEKRAFKESLDSSLRINSTPLCTKKVCPYLNTTTLIFDDSLEIEDFIATEHSTTCEDTNNNLCASGCCDENGQTPHKLEMIIPNFHDFYEKCDPTEVFQTDVDEESVKALYDSFSVVEEDVTVNNSFEDKPLEESARADEHPLLVDENIIHGKKYLLNRYLCVLKDGDTLKDSNNNMACLKDEEPHVKESDSPLGSSIESSDQLTTSNGKLLSVDSGLEVQDAIINNLATNEVKNDKDTDEKNNKEQDNSTKDVEEINDSSESLNEFLLLESYCQSDVTFEELDSSHSLISQSTSFPLTVKPESKLREWKSLPSLRLDDQYFFQPSATFANLTTPDLSTIHSYYTLVACVDQSTSMDDVYFLPSDTSSHKSSLSDFDNTYLITKSLEEEMVPLMGLTYGSNDNIIGPEELVHDNEVINIKGPSSSEPDCRSPDHHDDVPSEVSIHSSFSEAITTIDTCGPIESDDAKSDCTSYKSSSNNLESFLFSKNVSPGHQDFPEEEDHVIWEDSCNSYDHFDLKDPAIDKMPSSSKQSNSKSSDKITVTLDVPESNLNCPESTKDRSCEEIIVAVDSSVKNDYTECATLNTDDRYPHEPRFAESHDINVIRDSSKHNSKVPDISSKEDICNSGCTQLSGEDSYNSSAEKVISHEQNLKLPGFSNNNDTGYNNMSEDDCYNSSAEVLCCEKTFVVQSSRNSDDETPRSCRSLQCSSEEEYTLFNSGLSRSSTMFSLPPNQLFSTDENVIDNSEMLSCHSAQSGENSYFSLVETETTSFVSVCDSKSSLSLDVDSHKSTSVEFETEQAIEVCHNLPVTTYPNCQVDNAYSVSCQKMTNGFTNSSCECTPSPPSGELYTIFETSGELSPEY